MGTLKKIVNVIVMLYLVAAVLIYLDVLNVGQHTNSNFYPSFFLAGGIIMLLELIMENLYILSLRRGQAHTQNKINELKALLYDHKQELQDIKKKKAEDHIVATKTVPVDPIVKPVNPTPAAPDTNVIVTPNSWSGFQKPGQQPTKNTDSDTIR